MRKRLAILLINLCCAGVVDAQTSDCIVSGYLFKPDGSPAVLAQVKVINVVKTGASTLLTPGIIYSDASGFTSFRAPPLSTIWIAASSLGFVQAGDVAIVIPDAASATLDVMRQSARSPVSGISVTADGGTLALSLRDFGIDLSAGHADAASTVESFNGRAGAVTLTSQDVSSALSFMPLDPATVVGAVNASSDLIDGARLSPNVVRRNVANLFSADQTFANLYVGGPDTRLYRSGASALRTNASLSVEGPLSVGGSTAAYPFAVKGSIARSWNRTARFEAGANIGSGAVVDIGVPGVTLGARLYGGRWSATDVGGRVAGLDAGGAEGAWLHLNGQSAIVALNTRGLDRFTVNASGNIGINTASPVAGTILDVNGGDTRGLRLAPRSVVGPPVNGTWSAGTMIVDATGILYVCATSGSPGAWRRLSSWADPDSSLATLTFVKPDNTAQTTPIVFETNESGAGSFYVGMGSTPNPFGTRRDQVMSWGYNQAAGAGDRVLQTEHALAYRIENYWTPDNDTQATESHLVYINRAGVSKRVQSLYIDLNTDEVSNDVTSDYSSWTTSAGVVNFLLTPGVVRLLNRTQLWSDTNDYPFLVQKKRGAANLFGTLIYLNSADRVVLGGEGTLGLQVDAAAVAPAITGTRFLCISTEGVIVSSVAPCSGT